MTHREPHQNRRKTTTVRRNLSTIPPTKKGAQLVIDDWADRVLGRPIDECIGNPAATVYALRCAHDDVPHETFGEAVYGTIGKVGVIVHVSEFAGG